MYFKNRMQQTALFNAGEGGRREFYVFSREFLTPMNYDSDFLKLSFFGGPITWGVVICWSSNIRVNK